MGPGSVIGIVPIGYGDGFPRLLSSRGYALVHGVRVPIAGRVSMDMIALDLTDLPEAAAVGDEVVLLGRQEWFSPEARTEARSDEIDALELAELCQTITYEITCGFTIRVFRDYTCETVRWWRFRVCARGTASCRVPLFHVLARHRPDCKNTVQRGFRVLPWIFRRKKLKKCSQVNNIARTVMMTVGIFFGVMSVFPQDTADDFESRDLYRVLRNGKWGYINAAGEVTVPIQYDFGFPFQNGFTVVRRGDFSTGKRAFLRSDGTMITPFRFDRAYHFVNGFGSGIIDGKWGFVDSDGNPVGRFKWDAVRDFQDGYARVRIGGYRDGRWGLLDTAGDLVTEVAYERIQYLNEGLWAVRNTDDVWAVFRPGEGTPTDFRYSSVNRFRDGLAVLADLRGSGRAQLHLVVNTDLDTVYFAEDEIGHVSERIITIKHNDGWVYRRIDTNERIGAVDGYYRAYAFRDGRAVVGVGENWRSRKWGVLGADGTEIVPPAYDRVYSFRDDGVAKVRQGDRYGFIDRDGDVIVEPEWEKVGAFSSGRCPVMRDDRWGYVGRDGSLVVPLRFDYAWDFVDGLAVVREGDEETGRRFYITPTGERAFAADFEWAYAFAGPLAHVAEGDFNEGSFGYIDRTGAIVWELQN